MGWVTCSGVNGQFSLSCLRMDSEIRYRYCNVDPPVAATLKMHDLKVVMLYDIMCNYDKHFWERVKELPEEWRVDRDRAQRVLCCIPKFHLWAHKVGFRL